jgi:hypothetical protein
MIINHLIKAANLAASYDPTHISFFTMAIIEGQNGISISEPYYQVPTTSKTKQPSRDNEVFEKN